MEIKKLADIIEWADTWIEELKLDSTEKELCGTLTGKYVKEFETVKNVVLESMERHSVYTSALNNDIADKAAKIDLLEKEIEGRKEGYVALKELMDTKYISIEEHNNICEEFKKKIEKLKKESEKWQDLAKMNRDTICNQYDVCAELKEENEKLKVDLIHEGEKNEKLAKDHAKLENDIRKYAADIISQSGTICNLKKECDSLRSYITELKKKFEDSRKETIDRNVTIVRLEGQIKNLEKELDKTCTTKEDDHGRKGFKEYIKWIVKEEEEKFYESWKAKLNEELAEIFEEEEETEVKGIPCGEDAIE